MNYKKGDTWFEEIRAPTRDLFLDINECKEEPEIDKNNYEEIVDVEEKVSTMNYFRIGYLRKIKKVIYGRNFITGVFFLTMISPVILFFYIYNSVDFSRMFSNCSGTGNFPVFGKVIYSLDKEVVFEYKYIYNDRYDFLINCNMTVDTGSFFPVNFTDTIYISKDRNKCSLIKEDCQYIHVGGFAKVLLTFIIEVVLCAVISPCCVWVIGKVK